MDFLFCSQSLSHSDFPQRSSAYFEGYFRRVLFGLENSNLSRVSYVLSESYSRSTNKHTSCGGFDFLFSPGQSREDVQFLFSVLNEDLSCCFFRFFSRSSSKTAQFVGKYSFQEEVGWIRGGRLVTSAIRFSSHAFFMNLN